VKLNDDGTCVSCDACNIPTKIVQIGMI
jgi:hypothetical protein